MAKFSFNFSSIDATAEDIDNKGNTPIYEQANPGDFVAATWKQPSAC